MENLAGIDNYVAKTETVSSSTRRQNDSHLTATFILLKFNYPQEGTQKVSKYLGATSKFYALEWLHQASTTTRTQTFSGHRKNVVTLATWHSVFVHPCSEMCLCTRITLHCADHDGKHLKYRREIHGTEAYYAAGSCTYYPPTKQFYGGSSSKL